MAAKPYHAGHDGLVRIAAQENDKVVVFVSDSNRDSISGAGMVQAWKELIEPVLPGNVEVVYGGGTPVAQVYKTIGDADQAGSKDTFSVYSDAEDIKKYATLQKYAPNLMANGQVNLRGVNRGDTVEVSGTMMRTWLDNGDRENFKKNAPKGVNGDRYWDILQSTKLATPEPKGKKKPAAKKPAEKKPVQGESLLREFVRLQLGQR
jgi:hypothetical protein